MRATTAITAVTSAIAIAGSLTGFARPAAADAGTTCTGSYDITLAPGLSVTANSGTFSTGGQPGTLSCDGPINGVAVTGPGTWGEAGRYGVAKPYACADASGDFVQRTDLSLPTAAGPVHLVIDPTAGTFGPLQGGGVLGGRFDSPRMHGTFTVLPLIGDCVSAPITRMHVQVKASIS